MLAMFVQYLRKEMSSYSWECMMRPCLSRHRCSTCSGGGTGDYHVEVAEGIWEALQDPGHEALKGLACIAETKWHLREIPIARKG